MITEENLIKHINRYYWRRGKIINIKASKNLLGEPLFQTVTFEDESYVTFCEGADGNIIVAEDVMVP